MALEGEKPETLRETIDAAYDEHIPPPDAGTEPGQVADGSTLAEPQSTEPAKPGRTAGRARSPDGKLLPGKAKPADTTTPEVPGAAAAIVATPAVPRPPRPSSWAKEHWEAWEQIDPKVAAYINQREQEYARGVSAYKAEWDQVKPVAEAIAQFAPLLQQHGIQPAKWITGLGNAHKILALGAPEQKLSAFVKLAQDYRIPIEQLFVQGQDGKLYFNPQIQASQTQTPPEQPDVRALVRAELLEHQTQSEIQAFAAATGPDGQPKHPHFETVKPTMSGLLQANLATDLEDAYNQALALPRHADLAAQLREQEVKAEAERKAAESAKLVARARSNALSPKSSTPSVDGAEKPKGVRAAISAAFDQHISGGRM